MSHDLPYEITEDGDVIFGDSNHVYKIVQFARGKPAITLVIDEVVISNDRIDVHSLKERRAYAKAAGDMSNTVECELLALSQVFDEIVVADDLEDEPRYKITEQGIVWNRPTNSGPVESLLCNFSAVIVTEIIEDDGAETRRRYEIEARVGATTFTFDVSAREFDSMNWVSENLGARAVVSAGSSLRDNLRVAIQTLSDSIEVKRVFTHLGWREIDGENVYLHANGAISASGTRQDVHVQPLLALGRFVLPDPPDGDDLHDAIRASLKILDVAPDNVTVPLMGGVYRAPLGAIDFSLELVGGTGTGKTELAALAQRHWGRGLDARNLPSGWDSTANAIEVITFAAKDALVVVDDFAPGGTSYDVARKHREADRLLRAAGNAAGRQRLRADTSLRPERYPRGLILSTGEDVPVGQSLRARIGFIAVDNDDVDWEMLTTLQNLGDEGQFASAMAGYLQWIASNPATLLDDVRTQVKGEQNRLSTRTAHRRTPGVVANLKVGWNQFLAFAYESGAITENELHAYQERVEEALVVFGAAQQAYQSESDPAARFIELLGSAIASGAAHVANPDGNEPAGTSPKLWGWRLRQVGSGMDTRAEWHAQGSRVGWVDEQDLYLDPDATCAAVQALGQRIGDGITLTPQSLFKRLNDQGLLVTVDDKRETLKVRKTVGGQRRNVLHLRASTLVEKPDQPDRSTKDNGKWSEGASSRVTIDPSDPSSSTLVRLKDHTNPDGRVGRVSSNGDSHENAAHDEFIISRDSIRTCEGCGGNDWWADNANGPYQCLECDPPLKIA